VNQSSESCHHNPLCVASQLVLFIVVVHFVIDSVRKLLDTHSYIGGNSFLCLSLFTSMLISTSIVVSDVVSVGGRVLFRNSSDTVQPPIQWVPGAISLGVKRPGRETDHSHTWRGVVLS
jgi:hypothetical protein